MSVSINDVARVAGVSKSTVSRALGHGPVSEEVRARIEAAVIQTGYRPNLMARRLRSQHSGVLGLVVADIGNPFFTALIRAVEEVAYGAGLRVTLCNTDEDPRREADYLRLMQEERISGLIFAPTRVTVDKLDTLDLDLPTVLVDRAQRAGRHDSVVLDNITAMGDLVRHLVAQGRTRIGGLFGSTSNTAAERRDGYLQAVRQAGLEPDFREIPPTTESAVETVAAWLQSSTLPDAIVTSNSLLLMGTLKAVRSAGLSIPGDIALAGFDNERWTELVEPAMTVLEQPVDAMGRAAMQLLFERMRDPTLPVRKVVMRGTCIVRGSSLRG